MSDADALLAAISANPEDDAPLLAYADWLDEHGGERLAAKVRRAAARLTPEQWGLVEDAIGRAFVQYNRGVEITLGGFVYPVEVSSIDRARKGLRTEVRRNAARIREGIVHEVCRERRRTCCRKWDRVIMRLFKTPYLFRPLGKVITRKIRARATLKSLGLGSGTNLSCCKADDVLLNHLCGCPDWRECDPASVPDVGRRLKEAVDGFDPWAFDWSRCRIAPAVRARLSAAGFVFSEAK